MILKVWKGELKPDADKAAIASSGERAAPLFLKAKGFKKAFTAVDPATNKQVFIEIWESEANSHALGNTPEIQKEIANINQFYTTPLTLEGVNEVNLEM